MMVPAGEMVVPVEGVDLGLARVAAAPEIPTTSARGLVPARKMIVCWMGRLRVGYVLGVADRRKKTTMWRKFW